MFPKANCSTHLIPLCSPAKPNLEHKPSLWSVHIWTCQNESWGSPYASAWCPRLNPQIHMGPWDVYTLGHIPVKSPGAVLATGGQNKHETIAPCLQLAVQTSLVHTPYGQ